MYPQSDFLSSIGANLATDLIKAGAKRLVELTLGDEETRTLERLWQKVFGRLLVDLLCDSEKIIALEVENIFRQFIYESEVADNLIDLALTNREHDIALLNEKFNSVGFDHTSLPLTFDRIIRILIQHLNDVLNEEASRSQSPLYNWVSTARVTDIQRKVDLALDKLAHLAAPQPVSHPLFLVPFHHNTDFVGRESELTTLHEMLEQSTTPVGIRPTVLVGLGGIGKTQIAVEYAHAYRDRYPGGIFWLNAINPLLLEFAYLAEQIGLAEKDIPREDAARRAWGYLDSHTDALIVFDNVTEPGNLNNPIATGLIPANLRCRTLFTTRQRDFPRNFQPFEVKVLPEMAAMRLLLRSRQEALKEDNSEWGIARVICASLGWLPLALELAAAYLGEYSEISLSDYLNRLRGEGKLTTVDDTNLGLENLPTRHEAAIKATLQTQWNRLDNEDAKLLFRTAGQLPEASWIPISRLGLLTGIEVESQPGYPPQLTRALNKLQTVSLIQEMSNERLRLHPLVHEFAASLSVPSFRMELAGRVATALTNLENLERQVIRRGVYTILDDLRTGLWLCSELNDGSQVRTQLLEMDRILDRETQHLKNWHPDQQQSFFLQQIRNLCFNLGLDEFKVIAEKLLAERKLGFLRERFITSRDSTAILRTITCHAHAVNCVAVTPDGRLAVSGAGDYYKVWDLTTGQVIQTLEESPNSLGQAVAITPDGRSAVSEFYSTLMVWDLATGQVLRTLEGHTHWINAVAITPNGRFAVSGSVDKTLMVWDLPTGQLLRTLEGHTNAVQAVAITPDSRFIVSGSADNTLKVWDLVTGQQIQTLEGHTASVAGLAITPNGHFALSASQDGTIKVWDLATSQAVKTLAGRSMLQTVTVTPDGRFAVSGSWDAKLKVWDLGTGQVVGTFEGHAERISAVAITPDGRFAISASADQTLKVWDFVTLFASSAIEQPLPVNEYHSGSVSDIFIIPDSRFVVSESSNNFKIWDLLTGQAIHSRFGRAVALMPDGHNFIFASEDNMLTIWDPAKDQVLRKLAGHTREVHSIAIASDGRLAVSGSHYDNTIRVWDLVKGTQICSLEVKMWAGFTLTHNRLLINSTNETITGLMYEIHDLFTGQFINSIESDSVKVTSTGNHAVSSNDTFKVWDLVNGQVLRTLNGHSDLVRDFKISSDGLSIVSVSSDNTIKVWDLVTGQQIQSFECSAPYKIWIVPGIPGDRIAITASSLGNLSVWDLTIGKALNNLEVYLEYVISMKFSSNGRYIAASNNKTIRIWDLIAAREILSLGCNFSLRGLAITPDFRTIIAGDEVGAVHFFDWIEGK